MSRPTRIRSILALAIVLVGFVLWSISASAQAPGGPSAAELGTGSDVRGEPVESPTRSSAHEYLRAGDEAFAAADFAVAELEYRRAAEREPSFRAAYNLGVALARQGRDAEAAEAFAQARRLVPTDEPDAAVDAAYNAGTAAATIEELEESVEAYVDALRTDPHDREAKENLAQVLKQLRQQRQQQQQQQQQQQGEGDSEEESEPRQQDGREPTPPEPGGEEEGSEEQEGGEGEQPRPRPEGEDRGEQEGEGGDDPQSATDVEREEAERLLNLARELERETQERLKLGERTRSRPEKDW